MIDFQPETSPALAAGLVLRNGITTDVQYLRITHVFPSCVYVMRIREPLDVRAARRPRRVERANIEKLASEPGSNWGRVTLPAALSDSPKKNSEKDQELEHAWTLIRPLVCEFEQENNLVRNAFSRLIRRRADLMQISAVTLRKLLLRYYYFGSVKSGLLSLPHGPDPVSERQATSGDVTSPSATKRSRRGRKSANTSALGVNDFVVSNDDIADMIHRFEREHNRDGHPLSKIYVDYLANEFRARHPDIASEYLMKRRQAPVTLRQFRYYTDEVFQFRCDIAGVRDREQDHKSGLIAIGPGEITEIDSTRGRIHLISRKNPTCCVGQPTIYLAIDRWSRYIPGAYLSLRAPSYEELRYLLLIMFTDRESRFSNLDVDIDDQRWPRGRLSACICEDRGPDQVCASAKQAIADDLKIELQILRPRYPDGKAIVERLIRTLKARMASERGAYADRPMDRDTKAAARKSKSVAIYTLSEAYRILIELIVEHNNRPHRSLRRNKILTRAGVAPTPQAAYLWGLKNITGMPVPPLSDADYQRLLLGTDKASIVDREVAYRGRTYLPVNAAAKLMALQFPKRSKDIDIRVDKTFFRDLYIPSSRGRWAKFRMKKSATNDIRGVALDEEEALKKIQSELWAHADDEATRSRVASAVSAQTNSKRARSGKGRTVRGDDSDDVKRRLTGTPSQIPGTPTLPRRDNDSAWKATEQREKEALLAMVQARRRRK
ncbi:MULTISPECIES: hypothetical protein [Paraburkholderia]|uniref:Transposase family protein n=1 Tax=Paraburkholderia podalyriae TaxID=1938811 RepID=A0ABR7PVK5_9BURK|nr:hypothetical protein [Paraburkholderia podalyriae]MBC8750288.1 transposase family protein [Paraburkholderia podalyriae]